MARNDGVYRVTARNVNLADGKIANCQRSNRNQLHTCRGLLYPRPQTPRNGKPADRNMGQKETRLPQRTQNNSFQSARSPLHTQHPSCRGKQPSNRNARQTHRTNSKGWRCNRSTEGRKSDVMDCPYEQHPQPSRRNRQCRTDFCIKEFHLHFTSDKEKLIVQSLLEEKKNNFIRLGKHKGTIDEILLNFFEI